MSILKFDEFLNEAAKSATDIALEFMNKGGKWDASRASEMAFGKAAFEAGIFSDHKKGRDAFKRAIKKYVPGAAVATSVAATKPAPAKAAPAKAQPRAWGNELITATKDVLNAYNLVSSYARGAAGSPADYSPKDPVGTLINNLINNGLDNWVQNNVKVYSKVLDYQAPQYEGDSYKGTKDLIAKLDKMHSVISDAKAANMLGDKILAKVPHMLDLLSKTSKGLKSAKALKK